MALNLYLSNQAILNIEDIENYLSATFGVKSKIDFLVELSERLFMLTEMPRLGTPSKKKKGVFRLLLNKNAYIYYRFSETDIEIITIQDTRRNFDDF